MTLLIIVVALCVISYQQSQTLRRDPSVLMNYYYQLKEKNPAAAEKALRIILQQDPHYAPALFEYQHGYGDLVSLLPSIGPWADAPPARERSETAKNFVENPLPALQAPSPHFREKGKTTTPLRANPLTSLKEAGYHAIAANQPTVAIHHFTHLYGLTKSSDTAMQLGYLYDVTNHKREAYRYFSYATHSSDKKQALAAEEALTHLAGQQTKLLPNPYFSEAYFNPFTESRFGLTVLPAIWRVGIERHARWDTKEYLFLRRTQDNRSANFGQLSQLYEDNVQITGVGGQITPFKTIPLLGFLEVGEAYDLVYQNRNRWRGDLRSGLMYFQEFGVRPSYFNNMRFFPDYYSDWYADVTYFSRYNNNVIGTARTHQGIHVLQYHSSIINLYVTGRVIEDTRREFFNNIAEVGPGIAFIPSNRYPIQLRFEHVNGAYLPAGATPNRMLIMLCNYYCM